MQITSNPDAQSSVKQLNEIFLELFSLPADAIDDAMTTSDIQLWDSLRHMELVLSLEQRFGLELTFDEISSMQTIGAIRKLIADKTNK